MSEYHWQRVQDLLFDWLYVTAYVDRVDWLEKNCWLDGFTNPAESTDVASPLTRELPSVNFV